MGEGDSGSSVHPNAGIVGPAVCQRLGHAPDDGVQGCPISPGRREDARHAAHEGSPVVRELRRAQTYSSQPEPNTPVYLARMRPFPTNERTRTKPILLIAASSSAGETDSYGYPPSQSCTS